MKSLRRSFLLQKHFGTISLKQISQKQDRLTLGSDFSEVREKGKKEVSPFTIMLYSGPASGAENTAAKCGVICSRKFDKRAVYRNRARRLLFESFRLNRQGLQPCRIIFIPRRAILNVKMQDVAQSMIKLFRKAGLYQISRQ